MIRSTGHRGFSLPSAHPPPPKTPINCLYRYKVSRGATRPYPPRTRWKASINPFHGLRRRMPGGNPGRGLHGPAVPPASHPLSGDRGGVGLGGRAGMGVGGCPFTGRGVSCALPSTPVDPSRGLGYGVCPLHPPKVYDLPLRPRVAAIEQPFPFPWHPPVAQNGRNRLRINGMKAPTIGSSQTACARGLRPYGLRQLAEP